MKTKNFKNLLEKIKTNQEKSIYYYVAPLIYFVSLIASRIDWNEVSYLELNSTNILKLMVENMNYWIS